MDHKKHLKVGALMLSSVLPWYAQSAPVDVDLRINADASFQQDQDEDIRIRESYLKLTANLNENLRMAIKGQIDHALRENGANQSYDFDLDKFLAEAYIEVHNIKGTPVAFVRAGKQEMAFGMDASQMPVSQANPLHDLMEIDEVIGFTVALELGPVLLEGSFFETGKGDLNVDDLVGASARASTRLGDKLTGQVSVASLGGNEDRVSVGLIYKDKGWNAWIEGMILESSEFPEADLAVTGGVAKDVGPGQIVVEASVIQDTLTQIASGYRLKVSENLLLGFEARHTMYEDDSEETTGTVTMTTQFGSSAGRLGEKSAIERN